MSATESMIARLRRMTAEPTEDTYDDETLAEYIERYPISDSLGETPFLEDGSDNPDWNPSYDLNAAAADVWIEKAASLFGSYQVSADGKRHMLQQKWEHASSMSTFYMARRRVKSVAQKPAGDAPMETSPALGEVLRLGADAVVNRPVEVD